MGESVVGIAIVVITCLITYLGQKDRSYQLKYLFDVDKILIGQEYYRLITSGFLHANWIHLGFNMLALASFAKKLEYSIGLGEFLIIYFFSMLGGSFLSLYIHRQHGDYTAVGASGAVSGIVAATIILFPMGNIGLLFIPIKITSWIFGLAFILISILGIKSQRDNIGHEAHLGGILAGVLCILILAPEMAYENWWVALLFVTVVIGFLVLIHLRPEILITNKWNISLQKRKRKTLDSDRDMDAILEKIKNKGINSLTNKERKILDDISNRPN